MTLSTIPIGQKGNRFSLKPTERVIDVDGTVTEKPQNFLNYSKVEMIFRDPQGLKKTYEAALELGAISGPLIGSRIDDPSQTIDDTHINDGNDGTIIPESITNISVSPLNDADKTTYIEIPPGATLTFNDGSPDFSPNNIWVFFQGQPNARIILRMHSSDGVVRFQSGELSPSAANDAINAGLTVGTTDRATQSIENTGTETAYYAGWVGRNDGTVPTETGLRNFSNGVITLPGSTRPFTFVRVGKGKTLILKKYLFVNNSDYILLYVRGVALPSVRVYFYFNNILQGSGDIFGFNNNNVVQFLFPPNFDELHIEVLDDTNGSGIELGGVSFDNGTSILPQQITDWTEAVITSPAIFPFDENLNTDTDLTDGTWFFESVGDKIIKQIAITRPVGTAPNPDVEVQVLVDGVYVTVGSFTPELTDDTPNLININDIPRDFDHLRLISSASFQLHELVLQGITNTDPTNGEIIFYDTEGIIDKYGTWTYKGNTIYLDGTNLESLNASAVFAS